MKLLLDFFSEILESYNYRPKKIRKKFQKHSQKTHKNLLSTFSFFEIDIFQI